MEGYLAGDQPRLHATTRRGARAGTYDSRLTRSGDLAGCAANLLGVQGYRFWQAGEGGLSLSAIPCCTQNLAQITPWQHCHGTLGRGMAYPGLRQIADHGVCRAYVAHLNRFV